mmetsp:Transcript_7264/g.13545  ORF Transcript_7264/g.13545 Transcript_7264/m.13545 type:complete len:207 (-) Transcript_7264:209-829(-)
MEVLKSGDSPALVSNMEVMQLLQERMAERQAEEAKVEVMGEENNRNKKSPFQNRDWIEQTVLNHLELSPVGGSDVKLEEMSKLVERLRRDPSSALSVSALSIKDKDHDGDAQNDDDGEEMPAGYGMTNAETLQIINHLPTSLVEVHLLIEDIEKREHLDEEEKQLQFLRVVSKYSGRPVEEGSEDDDEEEDGEGEKEVEGEDNGDE